jgi:hypothetical protein
MPIPIAIVFTIGWTNSQLSKNHRLIVALAFFIFGAMLHVLTTVINWKPETRLNALSLSEYFVVLPLITICIWAALMRFKSGHSTHGAKTRVKFWTSLNSMFIIATVFCSLGVGLGYSVRTHVREFVDLQIGRNNDDQAKPTTSYLFRDAMLWLQHNSKQDDLVATNFIAGEKIRDFFTNASFPSSNLAISAVSRRRVLVEGDSWGNVGLVFTALPNIAPTWLNERLLMSHQFGWRPNSETAEYMTKMNINWFVVSKAKQMPTTWEPYASIAFENSEVIILKLN